MNSNNDKKLKNILKKINKNYKDDQSIENQFDSIQMLDLISNLENAFKIKILSKDINSKNFYKVNDLKKLIKKSAKNK